MQCVSSMTPIARLQSSWVLTLPPLAYARFSFLLEGGDLFTLVPVSIILDLLLISCRCCYNCKYRLYAINPLFSLFCITEVVVIEYQPKLRVNPLVCLSLRSPVSHIANPILSKTTFTAKNVPHFWIYPSARVCINASPYSSSGTNLHLVGIPKLTRGQHWWECLSYGVSITHCVLYISASLLSHVEKQMQWGISWQSIWAGQAAARSH